MGQKWFESCSWLLGYFLGIGLCFLWGLAVWPVALNMSVVGASFGGFFCVDYAGICLSFLSVLLGFSVLFWFNNISWVARAMILVSVISSLLCYFCVNGLGFWVFYEMTILPLLVLLWLDSPYSERYEALWYFSGYIMFSSLPMLLCVLYYASLYGGFDFRSWGVVYEDSVSLCVGVLLGCLFITKIPLLPFHVWLPIVHAEASSPVSVCLSGYVMKLGLLGVYRFCWGLVPSGIFGESYVVVCLLASFGFFVSALRELDIKRWLAFLSLGHIAVAVSCLSLGGWQTPYLGFLYSLGHGLSAGGMFLFIWVVARVAGTRNMMLLKHVVWGSLLLRGVFGLILCTVSCIPPSVQFFSELFLVVEGLWLSVLVTLLLYCYVFLGGLVPFLFFGCLITRHYDICYSFDSMLLSLASVLFLVFWSFVLFMVC